MDTNLFRLNYHRHPVFKDDYLPKYLRKCFYTFYSGPISGHVFKFLFIVIAYFIPFTHKDASLLADYLFKLLKVPSGGLYDFLWLIPLGVSWVLLFICDCVKFFFNPKRMLIAFLIICLCSFIAALKDYRRNYKLTEVRRERRRLGFKLGDRDFSYIDAHRSDSNLVNLSYLDISIYGPLRFMNNKKVPYREFEEQLKKEQQDFI